MTAQSVVAVALAFVAVRATPAAGAQPRVPVYLIQGEQLARAGMGVKVIAASE